MKTNIITRLAQFWAQEAHEDHFDSHRGVFASAGDGYAVYYDNCGNTAQRKFQLEVIKKSLGSRFVGEARYPLEGPDQNYTAVLVFRDDTVREPTLYKEVFHAAEGALRLTARPANGPPSQP